MIKIELLNRLLNIKDNDLKNLDTEKLRLLLGVFRYLTRVLERELIKRDS